MHSEASLISAARHLRSLRKRNGTDHFCFPSNRARSLDIMSDTKEQDHMTSKSAFLSCEKIFCHISKKVAGISSFCCFAAMSAVDLDQEISFGPLLLVITSYD